MRGRNASPHLARDLSAVPSGSGAWTTRRGTSLSKICEPDGKGLTLRHLQLAGGQIGTRTRHLFRCGLGVKRFNILLSELGDFRRIGRTGRVEEIRNFP